MPARNTPGYARLPSNSWALVHLPSASEIIVPLSPNELQAIAGNRRFRDAGDCRRLQAFWLGDAGRASETHALIVGTLRHPNAQPLKKATKY